MVPDVIRNTDTNPIRFFNCDCIEYMKTLKDNHFDLAITDPPYGGNDAINPKSSEGVKKAARKTYKEFKNTEPIKEYWDELFRVSKNQIVWGANFYTKVNLAGGRLVWDKKGTAFGRAEEAYLSMTKSVNIVEIIWNGMLQYDMKNKETRIHPTQKPIKLYRWLLKEYAKKGQKILDTHGGSFTHAIAADMEGFELDIMDLDADYFKNGVNAFDNYKQQLTLF